MEIFYSVVLIFVHLAVDRSKLSGYERISIKNGAKVVLPHNFKRVILCHFLFLIEKNYEKILRVLQEQVYNLNQK